MTAQIGAQARPITPRIALLYAAGDVGTAVTSVCLAFYWLYFLIEAARLPPLVAGLVHGSGYVVSAGANLWAGALLDRRLPDPRARCRLVAGLGVLLALAFAAMWALPPAPWRIAWYLAVSWAFHLIFALVYLAYLSLSARLGSSDAERVDLNSYRFGGTMLLTLVVLGLHRFTEGRLPLEARLQVLALAVAGLGALGALACGWGLRGQVGGAPERPVAFAGWRAVLAAPGLGRAVGANLAVWFMVQAALVLTAFLCAAAGVSDALVLLALQVATILAAGLTSTASRRWGAGRLFAAAAVLWCVGAGLWQAGWAPYPAAVALGLGLGFGTVLSWARVAEVLAGEAGRGLEGRAYAGLSLSRDLVAAGVPLLAALLMNGHAVGSRASGLAAGAGLLAAALAAAGAALAIRRPARTAADAGRAEVPT